MRLLPFPSRLLWALPLPVRGRRIPSIRHDFPQTFTLKLKPYLTSELMTTATPLLPHHPITPSPWPTPRWARYLCELIQCRLAIGLLPRPIRHCPVEVVQVPSRALGLWIFHQVETRTDCHLVSMEKPLVGETTILSKVDSLQTWSPDWTTGLEAELDRYHRDQPWTKGEDTEPRVKGRRTVRKTMRPPSRSRRMARVKRQ